MSAYYGIRSENTVKQAIIGIPSIRRGDNSLCYPNFQTFIWSYQSIMSLCVQYVVEIKFQQYWGLKSLSQVETATHFLPMSSALWQLPSLNCWQYSYKSISQHIIEQYWIGSPIELSFPSWFQKSTEFNYKGLKQSDIGPLSTFINKCATQRYL